MQAIKSFQDLTNERGTLALQPRRQGVDVDTRLSEIRQNRLAVAAVRCQHLADLAMIAERPQGLLGHGVDRERRSERPHI